MPKHRTPPIDATHLEWTSTNGQTVIVAPIDALVDWMHEKGFIRFGKAVGTGDTFRPCDGEPEATTVYPDRKPLVQKERGDPAIPLDDKHPHWKGENYVPEAPTVATIPPPPKPAPVKRAARVPGGESVCGFIDSLIMEGGRSKQQILELVLAKWPERDPKSTMNTIGVRPTHIKAKGKTPPPFTK